MLRDLDENEFFILHIIPKWIVGSSKANVKSIKSELLFVFITWSNSCALMDITHNTYVFLYGRYHFR